MKPVIICRYSPYEGPGYFATYLSKERLAWRLIKLDEGETLPRADEISGLGMMGGPMSVNDDLPWLSPMLALIGACVEVDVPVIGHCLGGQLLAKALGGQVTRNPVKEIGWGNVTVLEVPDAKTWCSERAFLSYHWHGETFSLPAVTGVSRIWTSTQCENQAFALGKHLAMQCHIEITADLIDSWCATGAEEIALSVGCSPAVQTPQEMRENMGAKVDALHAIADRVYARWIAGLDGV